MAQISTVKEIDFEAINIHHLFPQERAKKILRSLNVYE